MLNKNNLYQFCVLLIIFVTLQTVSCQITEFHDIDQDNMIEGVKIYSNDRQCALVGGLCVHLSDCNEPTTNRGLCSSSAHMGVECCYELASRPAPCRQYGGECMSRCHKTLMRPGTDCVNGQICCVLV